MEQVFDNAALNMVENETAITGKQSGFDWKSAGIGAAGTILGEVTFKYVIKPVGAKIKNAISKKRAERKAKKEAVAVEVTEEVGARN